MMQIRKMLYQKSRKQSRQSIALEGVLGCKVEHLTKSVTGIKTLISSRYRQVDERLSCSYETA